MRVQASLHAPQLILQDNLLPYNIWIKPLYSIFILQAFLNPCMQAFILEIS